MFPACSSAHGHNSLILASSQAVMKGWSPVSDGEIFTVASWKHDEQVPQAVSLWKYVS